ncbi:MAG TPA: EAL domain-containing protein [Oxalicibacterium sp.]|nr:EAL domain-containing protein [Oxalicibacterium sp.]
MRRPYFALSLGAALALLLGLVISAVLFVAVRRLEHDKAAIDFQQHAQLRVAAVQESVDRAIHILGNINQLFASFGDVNREQFRTFTAPLLTRLPYVQNFAFHRILAGADRAPYEARMRAAFPGFVVTEIDEGKRVTARQRPLYRVVDYVEPLQGNEAALGFDAASNDLQIAAMRRAVDTGKPSATAPIRLVQETGSQRGIVVLQAVYRFGAVLSDVASRRAAVIGDTATVFRGKDLIDKALADGHALRSDHSTAMHISVYASAVPSEATLIYGSGAEQAAKAESWLPGWLFHDQPAPYRYDFDVAGRPWHMVVSTPPQFFLERGAGALWVFIAGVLFSIGGAVYLHTLIDRSRRIQLVVEERTAQLQTLNQDLSADIAARKRAEQALQLRERAIEASANAIVITEALAPHYPIEYVNPAFERITGYAAAEVIGRDSCFLWGEDTEQPGIKEIRAAVAELREGHAVLRSYRKDGSLFWSDIYIAPVKNENGVVAHFVSAQYDITATKRYESELEFQTNRDALTGLANRNLLRDRLGQAVSFAYRYGHPIWVMFVDLDRFKFVNDTLGHQAGDTLLKAVAARLESCVRETDTVSRVGGDEFVLVLTERTEAGLTTGIAQRIMDAIAKPLDIHGHEFFISCSIGVAVYPADGETPEDLIKHADIAMYRAKETGRNNFQFYTSTMNEKALERLRFEGDLRNALEREEFVLHYQPQIDLLTGEIVGAEALIRWQHPELGMVSPARFIGLAEETGLIVPIGAWVIRSACMQNKAWQLKGVGPLRISVNLSARQFAHNDLVESIALALDEAQLAPEYLEIELTESLVMADVERAIGVLRELKALGVQLSIDDFGTGYSSLSYLKRFPIDVLKIDRSFVNDITIDSDDAAIVATIISLAHSLRLQVIAEGVETEAQLAYLRQHDCDQMQGYFFSPPLNAEAFAHMREEGKRLPIPSTGSLL